MFSEDSILFDASPFGEIEVLRAYKVAMEKTAIINTFGPVLIKWPLHRLYAS